MTWGRRMKKAIKIVKNNRLKCWVVRHEECDYCRFVDTFKQAIDSASDHATYHRLV